MIITKTLADTKLFKNIKIIASDLDHTLIDFDKAHNSGIDAIATSFNRELADKINDIFHLLLSIHQDTSITSEKKEKYDAIVNKITHMETSFIKKYGFKLWCREAFILLSADELKLSLSSQKIIEIRDIYWKNLAKNSFLYEDAKTFLNELTTCKIPLIIMTGSDAIMKIHHDLSLEYIPLESSSYKERRVETLPIQYNLLIIGDPVDKPDELFFERVFNEINNTGTFEKDEVLFVGDSMKSDLQVAEDKGYKTLLIKR